MAYLPLRTRPEDDLTSKLAGPGGHGIGHRAGGGNARSPGPASQAPADGAGSLSVCIAAEEASQPFNDAVDNGKGARDSPTEADEKVDTQRLFHKISVRLLPLFFVMVIMCYIDRTSLAFAAIQLNADLKFAPSVYGMGSGLFFVGYSFFQVPSNLLLRRFGGHVWLAGIIAAWGLVASAFAGMSTATHFYVLRLLLGAAEAGAFPGMWYVLTTFFPGDQITFPFAVVEAGISLSHVVAAPVAAACLSLDGLGGLAGWRWLFLLEGLPTLVLAVVMYKLLPRSPETADFLTASERKALLGRIGTHDRSGHAPAQDDERGGADRSTRGGSSLAGGLGAAGGGVVKRAAKARGSLENSGGTNSPAAGCGSAAGSFSSGSLGPAAAPTHGSISSNGGNASTWHAVKLAVTNKYVWYLGALKFVRDIASFGLIFWAPTIVNSLLQEMHTSRSLAAATDGPGTADDVAEHARRLLGAMVPVSGHGSGTGTAAVLLTALPFALAAGCGMILAHRSQRTGEKILHVAIPYIVTGLVLTLYAGAADRSPWLGFAALSLGVVGVYCGSGPCLSLLSELAAGPGLVVALPLYNSLGTLGGFLGPSLVGWLVQRAYQQSSSTSSVPGGSSTDAAIHGGGFGVSAVVLGCALSLAGMMMLGLGAMLGRIWVVKETGPLSVIQLGSSGTPSSSSQQHEGLPAGPRTGSRSKQVAGDGRDAQVPLLAAGAARSGNQYGGDQQHV